MSSKDPVAAFRDAAKSRLWGFVDQSGDQVISPRFDQASDYVGGLARVERNNQVEFIDLQARTCFKLPKNTNARVAGVDRVWRELGREDVWGLLDRNGWHVVQPTYNNVREFSNGLAAVNLGARRAFPGLMGGKWGFIDSSGKVVVPIVHDHVDDFSEGLACVRNGNAVRYIDHAGSTVLDMGELKFSWAGAFSEGLAPIVEDPLGVTAKPRTKFIDRKGRVVLVIDGHATGYHGGLSHVAYGSLHSRASAHGFIDRQGRPAIQTFFADAKPFSEGLAAATPIVNLSKRDDRIWGYVDSSGAFKIPPAFNEARPFHRGIAKVHLGGTWVTVSDAPSRWNGGEWWLIDRTGRRIARSD